MRMFPGLPSKSSRWPGKPSRKRTTFHNIRHGFQTSPYCHGLLPHRSTTKWKPFLCLIFHPYINTFPSFQETIMEIPSPNFCTYKGSEWSCPHKLFLNFLRTNNSCCKAKWPSSKTPYTEIVEKIDTEILYLHHHHHHHHHHWFSTLI
jgi:hypothetical protein